MKCHLFFSRGQIDDKSSRQVAEGIEFVRLTKIHHIPDKSLLISYLPMKLKMIEAKTVLPKTMIFESKLTLRPLEKDTFWCVALCNVFSLW